VGHLHAANDPAQHGRALVLGEIVTGARAQLRQDLAQQILIQLGLRDQAARLLLQAQHSDQAGRQLPHRCHYVHYACRDRTARHGTVLGFGRILYEDDAARLFHRAHAERAIGAAAAQNDRDAVTQPLRD
jgi:hypothetical protein